MKKRKTKEIYSLRKVYYNSNHSILIPSISNKLKFQSNIQGGYFYFSTFGFRKITLKGNCLWTTYNIPIDNKYIQNIEIWLDYLKITKEIITLQERDDFSNELIALINNIFIKKIFNTIIVKVNTNLPDDLIKTITRRLKKRNFIGDLKNKGMKWTGWEIDNRSSKKTYEKETKKF